MVNQEFYVGKIKLNTGYTTSIIDIGGTPTTSNILIYYTDFLYIFFKEEAGILALHGDYDHRINIEPGKSLPLKLIYPLSQTELKII